MANVPANGMGVPLSGSASITGSYCGFTVTTATTFTGLKDGFGNVLATPSTPLVFSNTATIPLFVTSASISAGSVLFYP